MLDIISDIDTLGDTLSPDQILNDYRLAYRSRQASLLGRREVLSGRAKFGIFGDGKEVAQLALAHAVRPGDWRAGYYRDQTLLFALGEHSVQEFFAQLYAHADVDAEPFSAGRQMNAHFATRSLNDDGSWRNLAARFNSSADLSPTAAQMPRLVGLGQASVLYREEALLRDLTQFSDRGNEIAWGTIGNASCAEGMFWEALNAIGVLQAPVILSIWDDGYGISVPNHFQLTSDLSTLLAGFRRGEQTRGFDLYTVRGWNYGELLTAYLKAAEIARRDHVPAIVHVIEVTQPQGHSTSGSHERYKSGDRLAWERDFDCLTRLRAWLIDEAYAGESQLEQLEEEEKNHVYAAKDAAWEACHAPIMQDARAVAGLFERMAQQSAHGAELKKLARQLTGARRPQRAATMRSIADALRLTRSEHGEARRQLVDWHHAARERYGRLYNSHLYSESSQRAQAITPVPARYSDSSPQVSGFQVLNAAFDAMLARDPRVLFFGEDVGKLGDVNQALAGLQNKYGERRVADTGIREATIIGQAIGLAMRGLRPVAEIQYLDYVLYALQILSDDLATLHWRTRGGQKAPVIVRTRGHRLEGVWHSGSPMGGLVHLLRGMHLIVPRDMTRAAGFYNTLLQGDEPGIIVEVLNGYRLKEILPDNVAEMALPLGRPEVLRAGDDVTVVTYGANCRIALDAAEKLAAVGIAIEVIDVQTLLPFDVTGQIVESLRKTSRIVFFDEDVPGGATAYMLREVLEVQGGFWHLDAPPVTLTAQPHRPAYGSDGDYFSKPNAEDLFETVYALMNEADPAAYPPFDAS